MSELTDLLVKAASNLSGYPVRVRWREPVRADARACAYKTSDSAVIELHNGLDWDCDTLLFVLCHESAHIKQLYNDWTCFPANLSSGSVRLDNRMLRKRFKVVDDIENSADAQAHKWVEFARANYMKFYQNGDSEFTAELRALANWRER